MSDVLLRIGISASFFHPDPERNIFKGKRLLYLEESMVHWVASQGVLPIMVPTSNADLKAQRLAAELDGLVLQGGSDLAPESYGETALRPEWSGDRFRDLYEIELVRAFLAQSKPILGICRGHQLLNVALGGSLYQDIATQQPQARLHRDHGQYDNLRHHIRFEAGADLARLYPGREGGEIITIHHQAIKELGRNLQVEAVCVEDGIIEAIRLTHNPEGAELPLVRGVQWHPEFQRTEQRELLPAAPLLGEFLKSAKARRSASKASAAFVSYPGVSG
ncbi:MAG: gamma-glutamyl-gamma-aminobutyrate hydrolase family protein [Leptospirales bacterium]|nr:gamma-glutamyl-gamma-aminobutyrate hydrolase family protein [Leptospirales bacterium]